jgi:dTDP-4-dehydrorhamnose 3,5-epimerase
MKARSGYKITSYYSATVDAGIIWNNPLLGISWPLEIDSATLSEKDRKLSRLRELDPFF